MQHIELDDQTVCDLTALAGARGLTVAEYLKSLIVSVANGRAANLSLDELDAELDDLALDLPTLPCDFSRAHIYDEQD